MQLSLIFLSVFFAFGRSDSVSSLTIEDVEEICESCPTSFYKIPGIEDKCYGFFGENEQGLMQAMATCTEQ